MDYEKRKSERHIFSFAGEDSYVCNGTDDLTLDESSRETELHAISCVWRNLPQNEQFLFSATERDDKKGFNIDMRNLKIAKNTALVVERCPAWLGWLLRHTCNAW